jgi:hypothetical protein
MTTTQLTQGLPANELATLNSSGGVLPQTTPLVYCVLREAAVLGGDNQLGPLGTISHPRRFQRGRSGDLRRCAATPVTD